MEISIKKYKDDLIEGMEYAGEIKLKDCDHEGYVEFDGYLIKISELVKASLALNN